MQRLAAGRARWLLFSDLHFKHKDLDRIRQTSRWLVDQAAHNGVTRAVICGDLLTSRTMQPSHVLSACYRFISDLSDVVPHINIVLGNHDLAYRRDYRTTALDALAIRRLAPFVSVHSDITHAVWDDRRVLVLPFREDQAELTAAVDALDPAQAAETLAFAHLAINRAILQRRSMRTTAGIVQTASTPATYRGLTGPGRFASLARTFTGHFHSHQLMRQTPHEGSAAASDPLHGSLMYLGSPLQLAWTDLGDEQRGAVALDPSTLACEMLVNPHAVGYTTVDVQDVLAKTLDVTAVAEKHVMLLGELTRLKYLTARDQLLKLGVRSVRSWSPLDPIFQDDNQFSGGFGASVPASDALAQEPEEQAEGAAARQTNNPASPFPEPGTEPSAHRLDLRVEAQNYVDRLELDSSLSSRRQELIRVGQRVIQASSDEMAESDEAKLHYQDFLDGTSTVAGSHGTADMTPASARTSTDIFVAEPQSLTIRNFLGVQGTLKIDFQRDLARGLVIMVGDNGSGKSTLVEAMVWCQFGRCIRSGLAANDVVNETAGRDCSVTLAFANGYTISRFRKDRMNGDRVIVSLHGEPYTQLEHPNMRTTQAAIEELLGIDYETYVRTVVLGHESAASFLNSTPTQRRDLIEQSLGLSALDRSAQVSRAVLKTIDWELSETQTKVSALEQVVGHHKNHLQDLERSRSNLVRKVAEVASALDLAVQRDCTGLDALDKIPAPAQDLAETDERIAIAGQNLQRLAKQAKAAELCIAFHAEMSASLSRLRSEENRLNQLEALHARHLEQKAAEPIPWWDRAQQDLVHRLEAISAVNLVGFSKAMSSAMSFVIRIQLSALTMLSRFLEPDGESKRRSFEATTAALLLDIEDCRLHITQCHSEAEPVAVMATVADRAAVDCQEVQEAVSAMSLEVAKSMNAQVAQAIGVTSALEAERRARLGEAKMREQMRGRLVERARELRREQRERREHLQHQHDSMKGEASIYTRLAEEKQASLRSVQAEHGELSSSLDQLQATRELFAFWASALAKRTRRTTSGEAAPAKSGKTFREYVLDQSLAELNMLLVQALTVMYDDTRHTTAMTTSILRTVFESEEDVSGNSGSDSVSGGTPVLDSTLAVHSSLAYGKRSGGERKRIDLAVFFALLQVRHARSAHRAHYVLIDEVFDSLDKAGQAAVVNWCAFAARRLAGWIIVITHSHILVEHASSYGGGEDNGQKPSSVVKICAKMIDNNVELYTSDGRQIGRDIEQEK